MKIHILDHGPGRGSLVITGCINDAKFRHMNKAGIRRQIEALREQCAQWELRIFAWETLWPESWVVPHTGALDTIAWVLALQILVQ